MKKILFTSVLVAGAISASAQSFPVEINTENWTIGDFKPKEVVMPASPLQSQILFIGGVDMVQTLDNSGNPNGQTAAKQWHDFIGFTEDKSSSDLGWVSINHERISKDDKIGDGGGMTVFKVKRDPNNDTLIIVDQTLTDGRAGKFFNVDFVNTVGETGMNCGGITSTVDGRIWTAEEWFRTSNNSIYGGGDGVRDTADWTISTDIKGDFDGKSVKKYENFNYMVEIDPKKAKAIRKQYNWGRQGFEGGAVMPDNKTVYLGVDDTPAAWVKFVAKTAGDFTEGDLFVYKHDATNKWIKMDNTKLDEMLDFKKRAFTKGATMYNRLEWVAYSAKTGKIYMTETGRDDAGKKWGDEAALGGVHAPHHVTRATEKGVDINTADYGDLYGRVLEFDPATNEIKPYINGGPELSTEDVPLSSYPSKHLSNPDGLSFLNYKNAEYMIICEDLNGSTYGRVPANADNKLCEMFLLNMDIKNPTVDHLIRIAVVPTGAEITGAKATPDGKTIMFNSQHPKSDVAINNYPFNNSLTVAIHGFDKAIEQGLLDPTSVESVENATSFSVYPNPATREIRFNETTDVALYDMSGRRVKVLRNVNFMNVSNLDAGTYFLRNAKGETAKLIIE